METLILFASPPTPTTMRTRFKGSDNDALRRGLRLGTGFLEDAALLCARWRQERAGVDQNRRVVFCVDGASDDPIIRDLAAIAGARVQRQHATAAGARIQEAFTAEFDRGARAVCAIGPTTPTLQSWQLDHAVRALLWERVVVGPTFADGLWLLGAQRPAPDVLADLSWASKSMLTTLQQRLDVACVVPHVLPFWYDVDDDDSLRRLVWHTRALRAQEPTALEGTWRALRDTEIVADGSAP